MAKPRGGDDQLLFRQLEQDRKHIGLWQPIKGLVVTRDSRQNEVGFGQRLYRQVMAIVSSENAKWLQARLEFIAGHDNTFPGGRLRWGEFNPRNCRRILDEHPQSFRSRQA